MGISFVTLSNNIRELIAGPQNIERVLRAYMKADPEDAWRVERSLKFRHAS